MGKDAPLALISIPGVYAAPEIERALDAGKHVFCFSDNVSIEDEARLKNLAHEKGLLLMGPDCGTGGRDLKAAVDGTTLKDGVALLDQDPPVKVIVVISKPPAKEVRDSVMDLLRAAHKPVVVVFMGERLGHHEEGLYQAYTLEETASNQRRWQKNCRCQTLSWRKVKRTSRLTTPGGPWLMKRPR